MQTFVDDLLNGLVSQLVAPADVQEPDVGSILGQEDDLGICEVDPLSEVQLNQVFGCYPGYYGVKIQVVALAHRQFYDFWVEMLRNGLMVFKFFHVEHPESLYEGKVFEDIDQEFL